MPVSRDKVLQTPHQVVIMVLMRRAVGIQYAAQTQALAHQAATVLMAVARVMQVMAPIAQQQLLKSTIFREHYLYLPVQAMAVMVAMVVPVREVETVATAVQLQVVLQVVVAMAVRVAMPVTAATVVAVAMPVMAVMAVQVLSLIMVVT